jgi:hypothetical protein
MNAVNINVDLIRDLAISTALLNSNYDKCTTLSEVSKSDGWDRVSNLANRYIYDVGLDVEEHYISECTIAKKILSLSKVE